MGNSGERLDCLRAGEILTILDKIWDLDTDKKAENGWFFAMKFTVKLLSEGLRNICIINK